MDPTVLQVTCGSCGNQVNVPASLLDGLLRARKFSCPHCGSSQQVQLPPDTEHSLRQQCAGRLAAESATSAQPPVRRHAAVRNSSRYQVQVDACPRLQSSQQQVSYEWQGGSTAACKRLAAWPPADPAPKRHHQVTSGMGGSAAAAAAPQWQRDAEPDANEDEGLEAEEDASSTFMEYRPAKLDFGVPHPDPVVETASLASVEPPDISYRLQLDDLVASGGLSALQLESIVYACQRHEQALPDGQRAGFFIGDGAGVGKGRTIAGLILENWRRGRKRHLWLSVGSDLRFDSRRDLDDVGAADIAVQPLNKLPYGSLNGKIAEGVIFLTYSSLISSSEKGSSRLEQLVNWCGPDFDGLIVYDECHKAKNLVPDTGGRATKVGEKVVELQRLLPNARVVYCSATGASEPRNLGYMVRLGLWGTGNTAFADFASFLQAISARGVAALELVAMDLKAQGVYVARTLSFAGAEFEVKEEALDEQLTKQYADAALMWCQLRREFLYAAELLEEREVGASPARGGGGGRNPRRHMLWRAFWGTHQRFFRHMCMASKIPALVRMAKEALETERCCVIGLQSTGEARTADVVAERGEELDDFVSGPRELLLKLVEDYYPMPADPDADTNAAQKPAASKGRARRPDARPSRRSAAAVAAAAAAAAAEAESGAKAAQAQQLNGHLHGSMQRSQPFGVSSAADAVTAAAQAELRAIEKEQMLRHLKDAQQRKDQVLQAVAAMELPNNPLDSLIDLLGGTSAVAEMTGRKGRLVRRTDRPGVRWEARNASGCEAGATLDTINVHERTLFLDGTKLIAVISEAASAGISLHADKRAKNQRRRVHLTLELPWSADKAIQQFGRSHRANQAHAPQYRLLFTPLGGEKRFAASVARRLESLGALTQGDRRAGVGSTLKDYNFESVWGQRALRATYRGILEEERPPVVPPACLPTPDGRAPEMTLGIFNGRARAHLLNVGIIRPAAHVSAVMINEFLSDDAGAPVDCGKITDQDKGDVPRFLNRLLGLDPAAQKHVFDTFQAVLEATVEEARREGNYDEGIVDVAGSSVSLTSPPQTVRTDEHTGAKTVLYSIEVDRGCSWAAAQQLLSDAALQSSPTSKAAAEGEEQLDTKALLSVPRNHDGFYRARKLGLGGKVHCMLALQTGLAAPPSFRLHRPATGRAPKILKLDELTLRYQRLDGDTAQRLWVQAHEQAGRQRNTAGARIRRISLLGGLVLPVWDAVSEALQQQVRAVDRKLSVLRLQTTGVDSKRLVGVSIPEGAVAEVLSRLAGRSGNAISLSDSDEPQPAPAQQQQQQQPWQYQHKQQAPLGPPPTGLAAWQQQQLYDSIDLT